MHITWALQCNDNLYSSGDVEKKILYLIPVLSTVTAYKGEENYKKRIKSSAISSWTASS